jgi:hypothetical protein
MFKSGTISDTTACAMVTLVADLMVQYNIPFDSVVLFRT